MIEWDEDGYPTEKSLQELQKAVQQRNSEKALRAFYLALCEHAKHIGYCGVTICEVRGETLRVWEYHTHGWSGNEEIIHCLEQSPFWHWLLERYDAGGHYYFSLEFAPSDLLAAMQKRRTERYGLLKQG